MIGGCLASCCSGGIGYPATTSSENIISGVPVFQESVTLVKLTHLVIGNQLSWLPIFHVEICPHIVNHGQFKTIITQTIIALPAG